MLNLFSHKINTCCIEQIHSFYSILLLWSFSFLTPKPLASLFLITTCHLTRCIFVFSDLPSQNWLSVLIFLSIADGIGNRNIRQVGIPFISSHNWLKSIFLQKIILFIPDGTLSNLVSWSTLNRSCNVSIIWSCCFEAWPISWLFYQLLSTNFRCVAAKGDEAAECGKFAKYYRALCPGEWVSYAY